MSMAIRSALVRSATAARSRATANANARTAALANAKYLKDIQKVKDQQRRTQAAYQQGRMQAEQRRNAQMRQRNLQIIQQRTVQQRIAQQRLLQARVNQINNIRRTAQEKNRLLQMRIQRQNQQRNLNNQITKVISKSTTLNTQLRRATENRIRNQNQRQLTRNDNVKAELMKRQANNRAFELRKIKGEQLQRRILQAAQSMKNSRTAVAIKKQSIMQAIKTAKSTPPSSHKGLPQLIQNFKNDNHSSKDGAGGENGTGSSGGSSGSDGSGRSGGRGTRMPLSHASSINDSIRLKVYYSLQQQGWLDSSGSPTKKACQNAVLIKAATTLHNHNVFKAIIKADKNLAHLIPEAQKEGPLSEKILQTLKEHPDFQKWGKYRASEIPYKDQKTECHFYMNNETHQTVTEIDYKVKSSKAPCLERQIRPETEKQKELLGEKTVQSKTQAVHDCIIS